MTPLQAPICPVRQAIKQGIPITSLDLQLRHRDGHYVPGQWTRHHHEW